MKKQQGFTLIELMIVVAIIGILSAFAIPAYQNYTNKTHATEMLSSASAMKTAVGVCLLSGKSDCKSVTTGNGVPTTQTFDKSTDDKFAIVSTVITNASGASGTITATVDSTAGKGGLTKGGTLVLTPSMDTSGVTWEISCNLGSSDYCPNS
ncbi:prepilin-type N-terminal cleavage/methylation domain-containing protein [Photobacterium leiognathi]|uniref:pilin n=1 Tax=Photobacterium leiognathi TaxID=553611 RepID=UPI001EDD8CE3|nr:prepilin-type N-terminal cleavage/methylation domain-containing protein [Photobacterium leiognathi]MCG3884661.1 prepilin-type N-terminal cleavage/methylation domain-containing protein [Photobacterium leiognathi]